MRLLNILIIACVILVGANLISNSIENSNQPDSVKVEIYQEKQAAKAEKERLYALEQTKAKEQDVFIESLSNMSWSEIFNLPDEKLIQAQIHYSTKLLAVFLMPMLMLAIISAILRSASPR